MSLIDAFFNSSSRRAWTLFNCCSARATATVDEILASIRVYREGRHGSQRWANLSAFSEATDLFRFRTIPGVEITTDCIIVCDGGRYEITSVEDVKGRGMYIEVLAKKVVSTVGKG